MSTVVMDKIFTKNEIDELGTLGFIDSTIISGFIPNSIHSYLATAPEEMKSVLNESLELNRSVSLSENGKDPVFNDKSDYETTVENLLRLRSIFKALHGNVVIRNGNDRKPTYRLYLNSEPVGLLDEQASQGIKYLFGPKSKLEFMHEQDNDWYRSEVLSEYSGRRIEVAGYVPDDPSDKDVYQVLREFKEAGIRYAFVKMIQTKSMAKKIDLEEWDEKRYDPFDIYMPHEEGRSEVYMVQEWIPMGYEYRFMIVNNKIVSGAASIEENTPLDRKSTEINGVLHLQSQKIRSESGITIESEIIRNLRYDTESLIEGYVKEQKSKSDDFALYGTVDMAMTLDENGILNDPVLVEINGLSNAGFFANSPDLVAEAIVSNAEQGFYDESTNDEFKLRDQSHRGGSGHSGADFDLMSYISSIGLSEESEEDAFMDLEEDEEEEEEVR